MQFIGEIDHAKSFSAALIRWFEFSLNKVEDLLLDNKNFFPMENTKKNFAWEYRT